MVALGEDAVSFERGTPVLSVSRLQSYCPAPIAQTASSSGRVVHVPPRKLAGRRGAESKQFPVKGVRSRV